jgi:hypothetical protein
MLLRKEIKMEVDVEEEYSLNQKDMNQIQRLNNLMVKFREAINDFYTYALPYQNSFSNATSYTKEDSSELMKAIKSSSVGKLRSLNRYLPLSYFCDTLQNFDLKRKAALEDVLGAYHSIDKAFSREGLFNGFSDLDDIPRAYEVFQEKRPELEKCGSVLFSLSLFQKASDNFMKFVEKKVEPYLDVKGNYFLNTKLNELHFKEIHEEHQEFLKNARTPMLLMYDLGDVLYRHAYNGE